MTKQPTMVEATRMLMNLRIPMRIQRTGWDDEYRVWGNGQTYFTNDLRDAVSTAISISKGR